jgi:hypothetical protein
MIPDDFTAQLNVKQIQIGCNKTDYSKKATEPGRLTQLVGYERLVEYEQSAICAFSHLSKVALIRFYPVRATPLINILTQAWRCCRYKYVARQYWNNMNN